MKKLGKKFALVLGLAFLATAAQAIDRQTLAEYAASLNGLKKGDLKTAIYNMMQPETVLSYGSGENKTWWGFWYTDRIVETNECINRYSPAKFYFTSHDGLAISGMNIEHSFPKSWWGGDKNNAYKDLYNLYPSESAANNAKSNYPMGKVTNVTSDAGEGYDKVGTGYCDGLGTIKLWEPGDGFKGEFARSYMYMATVYQNLTWQGTEGLQELENNAWPTLREWAYTLYLQWSKDDMVDSLETARNNAAAIIQGNRNLYVDFPYLAEYVWGDSTDVPFDPYTAITTADDDNRYSTEAPVTVAMPVFTPAGGTYAEAQSVTISCATEGTTIHYTTDGSTPDASSPAFAEAIDVSRNMTIRAVAFDAEGNSSRIASATYTIGTGGGTIVEGDTTYYFRETFNQCSGTGGNDGQFSGNIASSTFKSDHEGWISEKAYGASQCARFGTSSIAGTTTTPIFTINGTVTLSFKAAPWGTDGNDLTLSVTGDATLSQTAVSMTAGEWTTFTVTLTGSGNVAVTFTPKKRFFLDEVGAYTIAPPTAISTLTADDATDGPIYNLSGQRVTHATQRGIYIRNGKKFVVR